MAHPAGLLLVTAVYPLWVAAGLADWACHRATRIASTSGLRENLLHLVMFAEIGCAIAAMALLEVNAAVLLAVLAWDQALALVGRGSERPDLGLRWKDDPLPVTVLVAGAFAALLFNALPLAQETLACLRTQRRCT